MIILHPNHWDRVSQWRSLIQACPAGPLVLGTPLVFWVPESQVGPHTHQLLSGVWGSKLWSHASWQVLYPLHPLFSSHKGCYFLTPFSLFFNWIQFRVLGQCLLLPTPVLESLLHMVDKETPSNPRSDSHTAANCLHLPLVIPKPLLRTVAAHCGLNIILSTWPPAINV